MPHPGWCRGGGPGPRSRHPRIYAGPEDTITSTVVDLQPGRLITDLTEMDGLAIKVKHRLDPQSGGGTTVTYRVEVTGAVPDEVAKEVGIGVSADFPDVLANLVAAAQANEHR